MKIKTIVILSEAKDPDRDSSPDQPSGTGEPSGRPPLEQPVTFGLRMTLLIVFLFLTFGFRNLFAADAGMDVSKRITHLIQKVDELEKKHQQTLMDQDDILEQINKLKIVARK